MLLTDFWISCGQAGNGAGKKSKSTFYFIIIPSYKQITDCPFHAFSAFSAFLRTWKNPRTGFKSNSPAGGIRSGCLQQPFIFFYHKKSAFICTAHLCVFHRIPIQFSVSFKIQPICLAVIVDKINPLICDHDTVFIDVIHVFDISVAVIGGNQCICTHFS